MKKIIVFLLFVYNIHCQELYQKKSIGNIYISDIPVYLDLSELSNEGKFSLDIEMPNLIIEKTNRPTVIKLKTNDINDNKKYDLMILTEKDSYHYNIFVKKPDDITTKLYKVQIISSEEKIIEKREKKQNNLFEPLLSLKKENKTLVQNLSIKNTSNNLTTIVGGLYELKSENNYFFIGIYLENNSITNFKLDYSEFLLEKKGKNIYSTETTKFIKTEISNNNIIKPNENSMFFVAIPKLTMTEDSQIRIKIYDSNKIEDEDVRKVELIINYEEYQSIQKINL